jgi:hypothetical protein
VQRDLRYNPKSAWLSILLGFHVGTSTYCWPRNSSTFTVSKTCSEVACVTLFWFLLFAGVHLWATFLLPHLAGVCEIHLPAWVRLLHVSGGKALAEGPNEGSSISICFMVAQTVYSNYCMGILYRAGVYCTHVCVSVCAVLYVGMVGTVPFKSSSGDGRSRCQSWLAGAITPPPFPCGARQSTGHNMVIPFPWPMSGSLFVNTHVLYIGSLPRLWVVVILHLMRWW